MKVAVNGQQWEFSGEMNILQLLLELGMIVDRVAVEVNYQILDKKEFNTHFLKNGDKIEVISFVGGGQET
ncbi:MAG: sulfur carrier protein ThiS [Nitrospirae bacterium]|nr:sulfur carrier protein ThiS [Nitrospirota bacterium]